MEGIEKITAKIIQDSEAEVTRILEETERKARSIGEEAQAQADREREEILARGRRTADERLERLKSAAQMERRKLELAAKQEVLAEAFDLALEASSTGREQLIFSPQDRSRVGKQVVVAANEALVKGVAPELPEAITESKVGAFLGKVVNTTAAMVTGTGLLTLSEETRPIKGGFIMVDGDIEVNCAFETLVRLQREKLEKEVAGVLFP